MAYGGLRLGEGAALNVGDIAPDFGLRRVMGKGGNEVPVALPAPARAILRDYMTTERAGLPATAPLFVVTYKNRAGQCIERRITGQRFWKIAKAVGARVGLSALHPHALRHAYGAELLRRTKNLRVVQEQLRHVDVQTTTGYETHATGRSAGVVGPTGFEPVFTVRHALALPRCAGSVAEE